MPKIGDEDAGVVWARLQRQITDAAADIRALPIDAVNGLSVLDRLGVSERSTMGALASHIGALLVDHGWLRVLAGGSAPIPDIATANHLSGASPLLLYIAEDVLGGRFAIDGGGLGVAAGEVCYFGPDTLEWTGIGGGYSAFMAWALSGGTTDFYRDLRWDGWEVEVSALKLDHGISLYPPPFTREGQDVGASFRAAVPITELHGFYSEAASQLASVHAGEDFVIEISDDDDTRRPGLD